MTIDDARADLAYIRRLMDDTRQATYVSGGYFLVWGVAVGLGLLATWLYLEGQLPLSPFWSWGIVFLLGIIGTAWRVQSDRRLPAAAPGGRLIGMVWLAMGVGMLIVFFAGVGMRQLPGDAMPGLSSAMTGGAVFMTGVLAGINWLRNLAFGWWAGAVAMFAWPGTHNLLVMGVLLLLLYVIPGLLLVQKGRQAPGRERTVR